MAWLMMLAAMAAVLLTWAALASAFTGIGLLVIRALGVRVATGPGGEGDEDMVRGTRKGRARRRNRARRQRAQRMDGSIPFMAFWFGFAAVIAFLHLWHFLWPVNEAALGLVLLIGWAGFVLQRTAVLPALTSAWRRHRVACLLMLGVAIWLANRAIGPGDADDSGLYHYSVILWSKGYPVVPGLGNLQTPLALNNSNLLYTALLDQGPWVDRSNHLANGLLLVMLFAQIITSGAQFRAARAGRAPELLFTLALAAPAVWLALGKEISSPKTDPPHAIVLWVAAAACFSFLSGRGGARRRGLLLVFITAMCATDVTIKVSAIAMCAALWLLVMIVWLWRDRMQAAPALIWSRAAWASALSAIIFLPWVGRNIVMSGWLLFPSTIVSLPVSWRVPAEKLEFVSDAIYRHSRVDLTLWVSKVLADSPLDWYARWITPPLKKGDEIRGWEWLPTWALGIPATGAMEVMYPLGLATAVALAMLIARRQRGGSPYGGGEAGALQKWMVLPILVGIGFWFLRAPDPRYGLCVLWTGAAFVAAVGLQEIGPRSPRVRRAAFIAAWLLIVPAVAHRAAMQMVLRKTSLLETVPFLGPPSFATLPKPAGLTAGFHPRPSDPMTTWVSRWGTVVFVPVDVEGKCWNGPLPCGYWPPLDPNLRLRRAGELGAGFVIDHREEGEMP